MAWFSTALRYLQQCVAILAELVCYGVSRECSPWSPACPAVLVQLLLASRALTLGQGRLHSEVHSKSMSLF